MREIVPWVGEREYGLTLVAYECKRLLSPPMMRLEYFAEGDYPSMLST